MGDTGASGFFWNSSMIRAAMVLAGGIILAILVLLSVNDIHRNTAKRLEIQSIASEILGTSVTIGALYLRPGINSVALVDVKIANPPGYNLANAITIRSILLKTGSLSPDLVVLDQVTLAHTVVYLEIRGDSTNLMELRAGMKSVAPPVIKGGGSVRTVIKDVNDRETI